MLRVGLGLCWSYEHIHRSILCERCPGANVREGEANVLHSATAVCLYAGGIRSRFEHVDAWTPLITQIHIAQSSAATASQQ